MDVQQELDVFVQHNDPVLELNLLFRLFGRVTVSQVQWIRLLPAVLDLEPLWLMTQRVGQSYTQVGADALDQETHGVESALDAFVAVVDLLRTVLEVGGVQCDEAGILFLDLFLLPLGHEFLLGRVAALLALEVLELFHGVGPRSAHHHAPVLTRLQTVLKRHALFRSLLLVVNVVMDEVQLPIEVDLPARRLVQVRVALVVDVVDLGGRLTLHLVELLVDQHEFVMVAQQIHSLYTELLLAQCVLLVLLHQVKQPTPISLLIMLTYWL